MDEEDVVYVCDDCGEEFPSQASLDGHEADGCWAAQQDDDYEEPEASRG